MTVARSILLSVGLGALVMTPATAQDKAPTNGRSITTLARVPLKSSNGTHLTLGSRIRPGKPTLISIWASWCFPCIAEAPVFNKIRKDLGDGYNFIYINRREGDPDPDQPPDAVAQFLSRAGMTDVDYVVADVKAYERIVGADMKSIPDGKVGIPRVYLFDAKGRQIYTAYGFYGSEGPALEKRVREAMAK